MNRHQRYEKTPEGARENFLAYLADGPAADRDPFYAHRPGDTRMAAHRWPRLAAMWLAHRRAAWAAALDQPEVYEYGGTAGELYTAISDREYLEARAVRDAQHVLAALDATGTTPAGGPR